MIVEILKTDIRFGLKKGQLYNAKTYSVDPSKVTLLNRVTKAGRHMKKNPMCNEYCSNVKIVQLNKSK